MHDRVKIAILVLIVAIAISLNFLTLMQAVPETNRIDSGCCAPSSVILAKDFSAFYFGAWNLFHDPSKIYGLGSSANATFLGIYPHPESYKYLPSFLLLVSPFLVLNYNQALLAFDVAQFGLLFLMAFLILKILEGRNVAIIGVVCVLSLLLPYSTNPTWGISEAYFWQWGEGQSKVLELALILLSFYFASRKRPIVSGIFLGLSFFDPRFALISVPLFTALNRRKIARVSFVVILTLILTNIPIFILPDVSSSFLEMLVSGGLATPLYYYAYIPLISVIALNVIMWKEIAQLFSRSLVKRNDKVSALSEEM